MNDFGPAAMARVSAIYAFLTYPIQIGESQLPHGALFTAVREANRPDEFTLWTKTPEGNYLGVTPETQFEFFKLTRDIVYWSRHDTPNPADLESTAGTLYAFFSQYRRLNWPSTTPSPLQIKRKLILQERSPRTMTLIKRSLS
jgi:hypothetical protein